MKNKKFNLQSFIISTIQVGIQIQTDVLGNKNRIEIIKHLQKNKMTISDLQKKMDLNYKTIWDHVMLLNKAGIVILNKEEKQPGKPVYLSLITPTILEDLQSALSE